MKPATTSANNGDLATQFDEISGLNGRNNPKVCSMLPKKISEGMMDENDLTNNGSTDTTSEPHIVVACPSCDTKFAVESSLIAAYETPRFHCSRCDAVFEAKQEAKTVEPTQAATRWVLHEESKATPSNSDSPKNFTSPVDSAPLKSTDFTLGDVPELESFSQDAAPDEIENRAGLSILGFRPTASRRHSSSLTRSEARSLVAQIRQDAAQSGDPFALFDSPNDTKPIAKEAPQKDIATPVSPIESKPQQQTATPARGRLKNTISALLSRNKGMTRLTLPLFGGVLALCFATLVSRLFPQTVDSLFRAAIPQFISGKTANLPPAEISVQDLNLTLEKTQSKETIPVVRGIVFNSGEKTYEDVSVEALGFNSRGELLVRARAPLRSALSREKVSDLSLETVKKFQSSLSASNSAIKGGERVAFSVALFPQGVEAQEVTYFSARVFSVGKER
jgi:predicted Zn finger-like uncharacterized protein